MLNEDSTIAEIGEGGLKASRISAISLVDQYALRRGAGILARGLVRTVSRSAHTSASVTCVLGRPLMSTWFWTVARLEPEPMTFNRTSDQRQDVGQ